MPIFKAPVYAKLSVDGGASVPCYTFDIEYLASDKEDHLTSVADSASDLSLATLNELIKENHAWWSRLIQGFMTASAKLFSKTYSLDQLNRITKHVLPSPLPSITDYPSTLFWTVRQIKIYGGSLYVHWGITSEPIQIDLPDTPTLSPRVAPSTAATVSAPVSTPSVSAPAPVPKVATKAGPRVESRSEVQEAQPTKVKKSKTLMKKLINWVILVLVLVLIGVIVYLTCQRYLLVGSAVSSGNNIMAAALLTPELSTGLSTLAAAL